MAHPSGRRIPPRWATWERMTDEEPNLRKRSRWPFAIAALITIGVVITVIGVIYWRDSKSDSSFGPRVSWQPSNQIVLKSSMSVRPVSGWRLGAADLSLPEGIRFSTDDMPIHSRPLIGNIGDRAFLLARTLGSPTEWWLAGVDVSDGQRLFPAIQLNTGSRPECFLNGPDAVLCLTSELANRTAWVIDSHTGVVTYTGPTDLDVQPNDLNVEQVGIYAVAQTVDQGVYGVGPRANTTWFVPGAGDASPKYLNTLDTDPPGLGFQTTSGRGSFGKIVFSLSDGRVIRPHVPAGAEQQDTLLYPGGFGARIASNGDDEIQLFDDNGNRSAPRPVVGQFPTTKGFFDLPIISVHDVSHGWVAITPRGELVFAAPKDSGGPVRFIGSRLIINASEFSTRGWAQYDTRSGSWGKRCTNLDLDFGYLGYDGRVAVTRDGNQTIGLDTEATDLDTCERLWVISSAPGVWRDVWRINTTLVQLSDDGTELTSLVAP
ncbi:hypothetical protein [Mycolicibacterium chubuense]|nr:hypothetical protein [Mycolicibacterium chubuense]